jgi:hypothetical protein
MKEPWEWVEEEDILSLIRNGVAESIRLDYKACDALQKTDGKKKEISKDVAAFANSAGGTIIYGVIEDKRTRLPKDVDIGYDPADISAEWLEQVINSSIDRRISGVVINPIRLTKTHPGRVLYVVYIPESNLAPHMSVDDRFYRRFNFESVRMKEYEVRNLMRREQYPSREVVIAWRDSVINPLLGTLRREREYLERRKWAWDSYKGGLQGLGYFSEWARYSGDKEEFLELHPQIRAGIEEHDRRLAEVYARCNDLFEQIRSSSFLLDLYRKYTAPEAIEPLRVMFHTQLGHYSTPEAIVTNLFGDTPEVNRLEWLAQYIITDAEEMAVGIATTAPFWNTYGESFRALTKHPPLLTYAEVADDARSQLLTTVNGLLEGLTKTRTEIGRLHAVPMDTPAAPVAYIRGGYGFNRLG